MNLHFELLK